MSFNVCPFLLQIKGTEKALHICKVIKQDCTVVGDFEILRNVAMIVMKAIRADRIAENLFTKIILKYALVMSFSRKCPKCKVKTRRD